MKIKTPADLMADVKAHLESHVTALNGLLEMQMPEPFKTEFTNMRKALNEKLSALKPLEAVPAALDISGSLEYVERCITHAFAMADEAMANVKKLTAALGEKQTALNSFEDRIKTGDLIAKADAGELVRVARADEQGKLLPQIVAMRKTTLESCGLPTPSEDILKLPEAEFQTRVTGAKANVAKLGEKGLKIGGRGEKLVLRCAWLPETEFNGQLESFSDVLAPAAPGGARPPADPLHGNPGAGADKKEVLSI